MSKKKSKKKYKDVRSMNLVCLDCCTKFNMCECPSVEKTAYVFASKAELEHFFKTGLVPDHAAELRMAEGEPPPPPIPLVWPPSYNFKVD